MSIRNLRKKLHDSIKKYGINSKEAYEASIMLDQELIKYHDSSPMKMWYKESYEGFYELKRRLGKSPSSKEWNRYAKEHDYLSSVSMQYIGGVKFRKK